MPLKVFLQKNSFLDYPGLISSVLFFPGCNLRCPWCHNNELLNPNNVEDAMDFNDCLSYFKKREKVIKAVVLSGGEPSLQNELPAIITALKKLGLKVKLDTNGMFPEILDSLIKNEEYCPDYIALDLKLSPWRYSELLSNPIKTNFKPGEKLQQSAALLYNSPVLHEYRTLILPENMISRSDIEELAPIIDNSPWHFRLFKGGNCLDPHLNSLKLNKSSEIKKGHLLLEKARSLGKNAIANF